MPLRRVAWLWCEGLKTLTVIRTCTAPEHYHIGPSLPLLQRGPNVMSLHLVVVRDSTSIRAGLDLKSIDEPVSLFFRQEAASLRTVWNKEDGNQAGDDRQETFDDEYPL